MSEYTKKIKELEIKLELLTIRLKEAKEFCQEAIEKLEAIRAEVEEEK